MTDPSDEQDLSLQPPGVRPSVARPRRRLSWPVLVMALAIAFFLGGMAYGLKDSYTDRAAELSRSLIGDESTARLESWYFSTQDRIDRVKFGIFGGATNPYGEAEATAPTQPADDVPPPVVTVDGQPARPAPLPLPQTRALRGNPEQGEGVWTTAGLPGSTLEDMLMAKTFIRPDTSRPYALVGVLLLDKRRVRLHLTGGTEDPGGDRGVKGPGVIPEVHRPSLLAAWNGGFRGSHGGFGMYADGKQYRPLRDGFASIAVTRDGTIRLGEWGRGLTWSEDLVAVRQNAALLVENCEVSSRTNEDNDTWGYVQVNSADFITWRSAVGLTANGDLLVAAGNSLSAESLARALWAAGACSAMQLDINTPYVLTSLFHPQVDGSLKAGKFMESMVDNPGRFLTTQANDFMYVTLGETGYKP